MGCKINIKINNDFKVLAQKRKGTSLAASRNVENKILVLVYIDSEVLILHLYRDVKWTAAHRVWGGREHHARIRHFLVARDWMSSSTEPPISKRQNQETLLL